MDVSKLKSITELGSFGVLLVILTIGLYFACKAIAKYYSDKSLADKIEKEYYRDKIDEKDKKIEKIVSEFTEIIKKDLNDLKSNIETLNKKI